MRALATVAVAGVLAIAACSDSHPPRSSSSAFDPFAAGASSASAGAVPPTPVDALEVGDCFDTDQFSPGASIDPRGVHAVDCASPHQHEVYAVEHDASPPGRPFPGDEAMSTQADDECLAAFDAAVGASYLDS